MSEKEQFTINKLEYNGQDTFMYEYLTSLKKNSEDIEFKPINLLFGMNGSGKTTLSNLIKEQYGDAFNSDDGKAFVFNRDFIRNNLLEKLENKNTLKGFLLGKINKDNETKREGITRDIDGLQKSLTTLQENIQKKEDEKKSIEDLSEISEQIAKKLKEKYVTKNTEKVNCEKILQKIINSKGENTTKLDSEELEKYLKIIQQNNKKKEEKIDISMSKKNIADFDIYSTNKNLKTSILAKISENPKIKDSDIAAKNWQELKNSFQSNGDIEIWLSKSISLFEQNKTQCPLCKSEILEELQRIASLYHEKDNSSYEKDVNQLKKELKLLRETIEKTTYIFNVEPHDDINFEIINIKRYIVELKNINTKIIKLIIEKEKNIDTMIDIEVSDLITKYENTIKEEINVEYNSLENKINKYNEIIGNLNNIKNSVKYHYCLDEYTDPNSTYNKNKNQVKEIQKTLNEMRSNESSYKDNIQKKKDEKNKLVDEDIATDEINKYLKGFFKEGNISINRKGGEKSDLIIKRNNDSKNYAAIPTLSEGEITAISLAYFFTKVKSFNSLKDYYLFIDDPINSFDMDKTVTVRAFITSFLVYDTSKQDKDNFKFKCTWISSHNYYFYGSMYNYIKHTFHENIRAIFSIEKENNNYSIGSGTNYISYHKLLCNELNKMKDNPTVFIFNILRQFQENLSSNFKIEPEEFLNNFCGENDKNDELKIEIGIWLNEGSHGNIPDRSYYEDDKITGNLKDYITKGIENLKTSTFIIFKELEE